MDSTMEDFWRMIAQENVGYIIMLCDVMELGKKKCEKYIPEKIDEEKSFGGTVGGRITVVYRRLLQRFEWNYSIRTRPIPNLSWAICWWKHRAPIHESSSTTSGENGINRYLKSTVTRGVPGRTMVCPWRRMLPCVRCLPYAVARSPPSCTARPEWVRWIDRSGYRNPAALRCRTHGNTRGRGMATANDHEGRQSGHEEDAERNEKWGLW